VPAAVPGRCWSAALQPFVAAGRQRMYLQQPAAATGAAYSGAGSSSGSGEAVMLTWRVLLTGGSFHLVLFRWVCWRCVQRVGREEGSLN